MTPEHERLLSEMEQFIQELGGVSYSATYADCLARQPKKILSRLHTVPATYIRTRSDRICFFESQKTIFEYDAKTNESGRDFFVECLPVWHHIVAYKHFSLTTVYGFRWPKRDFKDIGIVIDKDFRDKVDKVYVYERDALAEITNFVEQNYKSWFPNARLEYAFARVGSGDPSIRICRDTVKEYPHWKDILSDLQKQNGTNGNGNATSR